MKEPKTLKRDKSIPKSIATKGSINMRDKMEKATANILKKKTTINLYQ